MWRTFALAVLVTLVGCGGEEGNRVAGSTLMGSALGVPGGPIGVAVGATLGAAAGVFLPPETFTASNAATQTAARAEKPAP